MRVLLDECVPRRLRRELRDHAVRTVPEMGFASVGDAELLAHLGDSFDAFITVDRALGGQVHIARLPLAVIVLSGPTNRAVDLVPLMPWVREILNTCAPGELHIATGWTHGGEVREPNSTYAADLGVRGAVEQERCRVAAERQRSAGPAFTWTPGLAA